MGEETNIPHNTVPTVCAAVDVHTTASWWRHVFDASPLAQALFAPGNVGMVANEAFAGLFHTTVVALLHVTPEGLLPTDEHSSFVDDLDAISDELPRLSVERRFLRGDGSTFVGWATLSTLPDPSGGRNLIHVALEDATWHLGASAGLARFAARSLELIESSPDIIAVLYPNGEWEASSEGTRALGYPKGFNPPGGIFSLIHPDDTTAASAALKELINGDRRTNATVELRLRTADGTYREFECAGRDLTRHTRVGGVIVTARDISARRRMERALRHAEERFRVIFEKAPLVISLVDLDGRILDINRAGCALLGCSRDSLVGTAAELTVHPDDRDLAIDATTRQLAGDEASAEFRLLTVDGAHIPVLSRAALVATDDENEQPYIITLQTDITERKHREADLHTRATYDTLTGLLRRGVLVEYLEQAVDDPTRDSLAAIYLDVDDFKAINDAYGHEAGDEVLRCAARRIAEAVRAGDHAARFGGDEFVVLCDGIGGAREAEKIAERVRRSIAQPVTYRDQHISVNASAGLTLWRTGDDAASIIRRADSAVYMAKRAGKAQTKLISSEIQRPSPRQTSRSANDTSSENANPVSNTTSDCRNAE